jgi:hypothetical protein
MVQPALVSLASLTRDAQGALLPLLPVNDTVELEAEASAKVGPFVRLLGGSYG